MALATSNVPTVLIGLGGCGTKIVNMVYNWIPVQKRDRIAVHSFDTNVNDIRKAHSIIGEESVTQISDRSTIGEYLDRDRMAQSWFPENRLLYEKNLTEGAGQIRAASRLALRAVMNRTGLSGLVNNIDDIFSATSDPLIYGVRVMIVSSLVGGTGSGIFLQTAMILRELMETRFRQPKVLIRGAFLLPDIFINTNLLDPTEWDHIRANGYAALKELNAITLNSMGLMDNKSDVTIELEYRPNQVDIEGRAAHSITAKLLPYDFCFLYDYENLNGGHLTDYQSYLEQTAKSIYMQLFSPISSEHFSVEDNQIRSLIASKGLERYCGSGVASLAYPFRDVVEYCTLKWSVEGLDESWLLLDQLYNEEMKRYEADLRNGISREKPDRGERYIWCLENIAEDEKPRPFFRKIYRQLRIEGEKGALGDTKANLFIQSLEDHLKQILNEDVDLKEAESLCVLDEGKLKLKDKAPAEIARVESALSYYWELIGKKVFELRTFITHQALFQDYNSVNGHEGQSYRLNTWLLGMPEPLHPVGVRCFLYQVLYELSKMIPALREKNHNLKTKIKNYEKTYDLSETEERVETAVVRVRMSLKQGFLSSKFRNQFKEFSSEYMEKSRRQLDALKNYCGSFLSELVFTSIDETARQMAADWERFFENLKDTRNSLLNEINLRAVQYEKQSDPTKNYVLASRPMLENMWETFRSSLDSGMLSQKVSAQIYLSQYRNFCARREGGFLKEQKVEEMYREHVVSYCREELLKRYKDRLELSVVKALRNEAEYKKIDPDMYVEESIARLSNLSLPFIPRINSARELQFWGLHPENKKEMSQTQLQDLFKGKDIVDEAFSPYEIICYRSHYGLSAQDFSKFSSGLRSDHHLQEPGSYYIDYIKLVNRLNRNQNVVTPHLDKRWHLPAFMPDLNSNQVELDKEKVDRALLIGLIYGWLQVVNDEGRLVYQYNAKDRSSLVMMSGKVVSAYTYQLHKALAHNPVIFEDILERFKDFTSTDCLNLKEPAEHRFITGARKVATAAGVSNNIFDIVFSYALEAPGDQNLPEVGGELLKRMLDEIVEYHRGVYGQHRKTAANRAAAEFIRSLWEESRIRKESEENSVIYQSWFNVINNKIDELVTMD